MALSNFGLQKAQEKAHIDTRKHTATHSLIARENTDSSQLSKTQKSTRKRREETMDKKQYREWAFLTVALEHLSNNSFAPITVNKR